MTRVASSSRQRGPGWGDRFAQTAKAGSVFPDPPPIESVFNVKCNCFDNDDPSSQLYPNGWYSWSTWCPPAFCIVDQQGGGEFETAVSNMDSGYYSIAETQFKTIIESYPGNTFAKESVKKLIPLKDLSDKDFPALKIYFDSTPELHQDSLTNHLIYRLKNKCDIEMKNYSAAIAWFENDIVNPASVDDSLFSLIDLGDTYLLMSADTTLKSSQTGYSGTLLQYKPKNRDEYIHNREEWIKLLFNDKGLSHDNPSINTNKTTLVKQNMPNPFSAFTEIYFTIDEASRVVMHIMNILGQEVKHYERSYTTPGEYSITVDLSGEPDGIYLVNIYANGKEIGKIKALKSQ